MKFVHFVLLLSSFVSFAAPKVAAAKKPPQVEAAVGGDRTLTITDATTMGEVRLAPPGQTTTLTFPIDVVPDKVVHADPKMRLFQPMAQGALIVITTKEALGPGTSVPLTVTLVDGTQLNFALIGATGAFDRFVRVELAMTERAGAGNAQRLKTQLQEVQSRLDECLHEGADEGVRKLGASILKQDLSKPDVFTVEKRAYRSGIDKQNRLLVETHYLFRLFDLTYLVITTENRDPTKPWVLERAELSAVGSSAAVDVKVTSVEQELNVIPPGEMSKMVIAFRMPQLESSQRFTLKLFEKNGSRHFELPDMHF